MSLLSDTFNTSFLAVVKLYSLTVSGWFLKLSLESVSVILYVQPSSKPGTAMDELFSISGVIPVITYSPSAPVTLTMSVCPGSVRFFTSRAARTPSASSFLSSVTTVMAKLSPSTFSAAANTMFSTGCSCSACLYAAYSVRSLLTLSSSLTGCVSASS